MGVGKIAKKIVTELISKIVVKNKIGKKTYLLNEKEACLLKYKEAYIVATSEIDRSNGLPRDILTFTNELQQVIHEVCKLSIGNLFQPKSAQRYARRVIWRLNREEEEAEGQKRKTSTVMIKILFLIHKRENQSDARLV